MRDFSSRYFVVCEPQICPDGRNLTFMNLPKRELLSLRTVRALPNASRIGEHELSLWPTRRPSFFSSSVPRLQLICARYFITIFVASVLPAPDSPEMRMHWFELSTIISLYVLCAWAQECGKFLSMMEPSARYFGIWSSM
jgi:hypothetical protein